MIISALLAAAVTALILAFKIPIPGTGGYVHLGDSVIYLASYLLPAPYAAAVGALGGALADLSVGAAVYVFPTALIKAMMAWEASVFFKRSKKMSAKFAALALGTLILVGGYFLFELLFWGWAYAVSGILWNLIQGIAGGLFYLVLFKAADLIKGRFEKN